MMSRMRLALVASWVALLATGMVQPAMAEDVCPVTVPRTAADVRGTAWSGVVIRDEPTAPIDDTGYQPWIVTFDVTGVYARDPAAQLPFEQQLVAGQRFRVAVSNCGGRGDLGMAVGNRYLVTTGEFIGDLPLFSRTAAWRLHGQDARLVNMYGRTITTGPLLGARTLGEALGLVAPNALPPTEAAGPAASNGVAPWPLLAAALIGAALWILRRRSYALRLGTPWTRSGR